MKISHNLASAPLECEVVELPKLSQLLRVWFNLSLAIPPNKMDRKAKLRKNKRRLQNLERSKRHLRPLQSQSQANLRVRRRTSLPPPRKRQKRKRRWRILRSLLSLKFKQLTLWKWHHFCNSHLHQQNCFKYLKHSYKIGSTTPRKLTALTT